MSKKKKEMTQEQRLCHLPNYLHLDACRQGGRVFRNIREKAKVDSMLSHTWIKAEFCPSFFFCMAYCKCCNNK